MDRNGQNIAIGTIITIVLVLLVLIGSILVYTRFSREGQTTLGACENLGGSCEVGEACPDGRSHNTLGDRSCEKETENSICCMLGDSDATA